MEDVEKLINQLTSEQLALAIEVLKKIRDEQEK